MRTMTVNNEECNLSDQEEEKKIKIVDNNQKKKAFLSAANIMGNSHKTQNTTKGDKEDMLGNDKALSTFSMSMA